ncbi:MAG: hypothetical protein NVSMB25_25040 [Thermoleophilaceae bacterium]
MRDTPSHTRSVPLEAPIRAPADLHRPDAADTVNDAPSLTIADVALFYGERSGGIRTYLDAKAAYAERSAAFRHHLIVPGRHERHEGSRHELRSLIVTASNGYRVPLGTTALEQTLRMLAPDVILVHDPFWSLFAAARVGEELEVPVVAVHHASSQLDAAGIPGPTGVYRHVLRHWMRRGYRRVDAVMSAVDAEPDGRAASIPLRFGLDPAFSPRPVGSPGDHVLYAGRIAREKGIFDLLEAAACSQEAWDLHIVGCGPALSAVESRARRLGLSERLRLEPFIADPARLARAYAEASCVVMPGRYETFGLVALEAAASGGRVVACDAAPSAQAASGLVETFSAGDRVSLAAAIARARRRSADARAAAALAERFTWERAFEAELADIEQLAR